MSLRIHTRIPASLYGALAAECRRLDIPIADGVRAAISAWTGCPDIEMEARGRPRKIAEAQSDAA